MASESTPRINAKYLQPFTNQTVRILGKVTSLRGETATIDANGSINIHLTRVCLPQTPSSPYRPLLSKIKAQTANAPTPQDSHLALNNAVEIIGKVQPDLSVKVLQATDFGDGIDWVAVEAVVDATHRYKEIFYEEG